MACEVQEWYNKIGKQELVKEKRYEEAIDSAADSATVVAEVVEAPVEAAE